jgi:N-ethylmaleimide reductase
MADLFTPLSVGPFDLPHRVVMAPMTRNRAGDGNAPHTLNATYYQQRSDAAFIITEATQICPEGMGYPGTPGIHSNAQIDGWREVTDVVHEAGGRIILQMWHVGRISHPDLQPDGKDPVAPSAIQPAGEAMTLSGMKPFVTPRALEAAEIEDLVDQYRVAAKNADMAGFDGVEVHGANGYLLDQFTRDSTNARDDEYGGSVENRCRFPLAVTDAVVDVWGPERVGYRISPFQPYNDISDSDPAATFTYLATELAKRDLLYLHMVELGDARGGSSFPDSRDPLFADLRKIWPNTLITNGGYDRAMSDAVIDAGLADMVAFGAPYLANPDLPERLLTGAAYNDPDRATFYSGAAAGYTDYPALGPALGPAAGQ